MATVGIQQLRERLADMECRRAHYEWKSGNTEQRLRRHEYLADRYLLGATDKRLAARFRDVFANQTERVI